MNSKPRIAFTTTVYDHTGVGGGTFVRYLRQAVEDKRLNIVFFTDDIGEPVNTYERPVLIPAWAQRLPGGWLTRSYFFHKAVQADHEIRPFDLIWHNNVITSLFDVSKPYGVSIVGMVNDYNNADSRSPFATRSKFGAARSFIRFGWHQFEKYAARRADTLIVNSNFMAERIATAYGIEMRRIRVLLKGVDLREFDFSKPGEISPPVKVLFAKHDFVRGGLQELLGTLSTFPIDVRLTIVGPPVESRARIQAMCARAEMAEKVEIIDPVGRAEMRTLFKTHDILCIPSRSEALGVAFMEALSCGLPAIGTNVGGIPEVLDCGRGGWLVESGNPESIRGALLDVIKNDEERRRRTIHGRKHVTRFSHENMLDEMNAIARTVVESSELSEPCV